MLIGGPNTPLREHTMIDRLYGVALPAGIRADVRRGWIWKHHVYDACISARAKSKPVRIKSGCYAAFDTGGDTLILRRDVAKDTIASIPDGIGGAWVIVWDGYAAFHAEDNARHFVLAGGFKTLADAQKHINNAYQGIPWGSEVSDNAN